MKSYTVRKENLTERILNIVDDDTQAVKETAIDIDTYSDLIMEVADLSIKNPGVVLFFRGQHEIHRAKKYASLYPSIFRSKKGKVLSDFKKLEYASDLLKVIIEDYKDEYNQNAINEIQNIELLRHSLLQHYGICGTPLLDITQSLKVACSFSLSSEKGDMFKDGYIFVLALPYVNGRITVNYDEYITNIRLLSIGTSISKRPYFQEGYMVRSIYDVFDYDTKEEYDFKNRLLAIYHIKNNKRFWGPEHILKKEQLYPKEDSMKEIADQITKQLDKTIISEDRDIVRGFLHRWNLLEKNIKNSSNLRNRNDGKYYNYFKDGLETLVKKEDLPRRFFSEINDIKSFRNKLVHRTEFIPDSEIVYYTNKVNDIVQMLNI